MEDDPFERTLRREEEIRRRLQTGRIAPDEADELRDLAGATDTRETRGDHLRLTTDQIQRIADEGVDASVLAALLEVAEGLSIDDAIGLCVDYDPDVDSLREMVRAGIRPRGRDLAELWDNGVSGETLHAAAAYGSADPVATALLLTERANDPTGLLRRLTEVGVTGLSDPALERVADNDLDPRLLARMLAASPDLTTDEAIDLCIQEVDPEVVARLYSEGIALDPERFGRPSTSISLVNLRIGRRQLVVGGGNQRIRHSGRVDGVFLGDLTINPGLEVDLAALVIGDLHIEPGARVDITGRVLGDVRRHDADESVTG